RLELMRGNLERRIRDMENKQATEATRRAQTSASLAANFLAHRTHATTSSSAALARVEDQNRKRVEATSTLLSGTAPIAGSWRRFVEGIAILPPNDAAGKMSKALQPWALRAGGKADLGGLLSHIRDTTFE